VQTRVGENKKRLPDREVSPETREKDTKGPLKVSKDCSWVGSRTSVGAKKEKQTALPSGDALEEDLAKTCAKELDHQKNKKKQKKKIRIPVRGGRDGVWVLTEKRGEPSPPWEGSRVSEGTESGKGGKDSTVTVKKESSRGGST